MGTRVFIFVVGLLSIGAVALVGLSRLYDPFAGDQALFLVGAEKLHDGAALYRDFWDLKQPGIYYFFLVAGDIFGFTQIGEHTADLVWQLAFAVTLCAALAPTLRRRGCAFFAPVAVVGSYYAGSSSWHLMQVEGLVGFPLFCSIWAAIAADRALRWRRWLFIASGAAAGLVVLFKAFLGVVAFAVLASIVVWGRQRTRVTDGLRGFGWIAAGVAAPLLLTGLAMLANGTLAAALVTTFVIPYQIVVSVSHAPFSRLYDSTMRLLLYYRGIILLGAVGAIAGRETRSRPWRVACLGWIIAGSLAIVAQVESWWQYHVLLIVPPIAILSTFGFDYVLDHVLKGRWTTIAGLAAAGFVAYVAVPLPQGAIGTLLRVAREKPYASAATLERYRVATSSEYEVSFADAAKLERRAIEQRQIYVFGEPLIYVIAGRGQAIAMNGWAPQINTRSLWQRTYRELSDVRPRDIFVNENFHRYLAFSLDGRIDALLQRDYVVRERTGDGAWYALRQSSSRRTGAATVIGDAAGSRSGLPIRL